nr:MAG TPA: hypothetical protein [Caudoviricetes sp.]
MHLTSFRVVLKEDPGALSFRRREMGKERAPIAGCLSCFSSMIS